MAGRPSSPVLTKGSEFASRIKAKFSRTRRRRSAAPSLESSWSEASTTSPTRLREQASSLSTTSPTQQQHPEQHHGEDEAHHGGKAAGAEVNLSGAADLQQPNVSIAAEGAEAGATAPSANGAGAGGAADGGADEPAARTDSGGGRHASSPSATTNAPSSASSPKTSPIRHLTKSEPGNDQRQTSALHPSSTLHSINEASTSTLTSTTSTSTPGDDDDDDDEEDDEDSDHQSDNGVDQAPLSHPVASSPFHGALAIARGSQNVDLAASTSSRSDTLLVRRQSLIPNRQTGLINSLLDDSQSHDNDGALLSIKPKMVARKIWVKRPGASATLVTINEDDLVDDVRDMILRKYANSLGRAFDSPDLTIRICPREQQKDRILGPEEPMSRTIEAYFPGGQTVDEALIIDVPRRTPKPSPRAPIPHAVAHYYNDDGRPSEAGEGYFPPVVGNAPSPHLPIALPATTNGVLPHSMSVLGTGHVPPIPSPGGTRSRAYRDRPRLGRTHTSSPTILTSGSGVPMATSTAAAGHDQNNIPPSAPPLPVSPGRQEPVHARVATPPPRIASPRPSNTRIKKIKKNTDHPSFPGMLNNSVPPISVLIVEDNPINLKLLEAFVKKLKVRWQTAMNGRDAVTKWRSGGFHLVLMDIQLPVMNGLEATREIRRLERVNSIGVFTQSINSAGDDDSDAELEDHDRLENPTLFKSPVIIVALTASSLQSDRHEALAAGCNDFLTKPVNFVWLERKVMEWGCMQALIDFDGWRQWKDFSSQQVTGEEANKKTTTSKPKTKKNRASLSSTTT